MLKKAACLISLAIFGSASYAQFVTSPATKIVDSFSWDYSPSWMADTVIGKDRVWMCSDRWSQYENEPSGEGDVIKYTENTTPGAPQAYQTVLTANRDASGNYSSWEGACVCDPAVVRGNFNYGNSSYNMAMYYTASSTCSTNNKIGVAFSNDGINWTKFPSPIISTLFSSNAGARYGSGQAQVRNVNGGSYIMMWHTDTPENDNPRTYERTSIDGINFGSATPLTLNGIPGAKIMNMGVALSSGAPYFLFLSTARPDSRVGIYKIPFDQRFTGVWQEVAIVTPPSGQDAFESGFRTDIYGNLNPSSAPTQWLGAGCGKYYTNYDPLNWYICQTYFFE